MVATKAGTKKKGTRPKKVHNGEALREEMFLRVDSIRPNPDQPRVFFDQTALEGLASSIKEVGLIEPIMVIRSNSNGTKWLIDDGERRWRAHGILKRTHVRAVEVVPQSPQDAFAISVAANFCREGHTPLEIAHAVKRFREEGKSIAQMAAIFGRSEPWVYQYDSINKLHPEVQAMMSHEIPEKRRLKVPIAQMLARLTGHDEVQLKLAKKIVKNGYSAKKAQSLIRQAAAGVGVNPYKGKRNPGRDFNQLRTFVENVAEQAPLFAEMPGKEFNNMFNSRGTVELGVLIELLHQASSDLTGLQEEVEAIYLQKFGKHYFRDKGKKN